ncbi:helix-turn-helix transcriptional regulator [Cytophagales bacterium WSM2-2]|nr:helix-turn-helix transcriptional regulator [Cytophagales bacterium WSM2-2]
MTFLKQLFRNSQHIILYAALMGGMVFILKWLQWKYLITDNSSDIYIALIALLFTFLGVWLANQTAKTKMQTVVVEKEVYLDTNCLVINETELKKLSLSNREYEVLLLLMKGHSNAAIAESLFLSLSTVKTHVSNLLVKMDVKSRTQAIEKARRLRIAP